MNLTLPHITLQLEQYSLSWYTAPLLLTSLATVACCCLIIRRCRLSRMGWLTGLWSFAGVVWLMCTVAVLCSPSVAERGWWASWAGLTFPLFVASCIHFILESIGTGEQRSGFIRFNWVVATLFSCFALRGFPMFEGEKAFNWGIAPQLAIAGKLMALWGFSAMVASTCFAVRQYKLSSTGSLLSRRIGLLAVANALAVFITLDGLPMMGVDSPPLGWLAWLSTILLITYIARRHRLADLSPDMSLSTVVDRVRDPMLICDGAGEVRLCNRSAAELFGTSQASIVGIRLEQLSKQLPTPDSDLSETSELKLDDRCYSVSVTQLPSNGHEPARIYSLRDITELREIEEKLRHDSLHDPLTGLANRRLFEDHLRRAVYRAKRGNHDGFAVLYLDLDHFKPVNDEHGHDVGDQLLSAVADRLLHCLRDGDVLARLGGDEFALIAFSINYSSAADELSSRIRWALRRPFFIQKLELKLSCSVGIAMVGSDCVDGRAILRGADAAMYKAKRAGGDRSMWLTEPTENNLAKPLLGEPRKR